MIKNKNRGDLLTAGARGRGAEGEHFSFSRFTLADVFEKNEKKDKTTSVYRLNENKTDWFRSQGPRFYSRCVGTYTGGLSVCNRRRGKDERAVSLQPACSLSFTLTD